MINRGGPAFVVKMMAATSADAGQVAAAFCLARDAYGLERLYDEIDALDGQIAGRDAARPLCRGRHAARARDALAAAQRRLRRSRSATWCCATPQGVTDVQGLLASLVPRRRREDHRARAPTASRPAARRAGIARRIAELSALSFATDIALVAAAHREPGRAPRPAPSSACSTCSASPAIIEDRRPHRARRPLRPHGARPGARQSDARPARPHRRRARLRPRRHRHPPRRLAPGRAPTPSTASPPRWPT